MDTQKDLLVSICCITYNHEEYIAQTLASFLMQRYNFQLEIIIGEDYSTDNTAKILDYYQKKHPGLIRIVRAGANVGSIKNQLLTMKAAKGKYIAMCDGDDFWTDPLKLQKQVDYLESHPDYGICCHYTRVINEKGQTVYLHPRPESLEFDYEDLLLGKREETRICSLMIRNDEEIRSIGLQDWYHKSYGSDTLFKLYALRSGKKIYVIPKIMACYRLHSGGIWSMIDPKLRKSRMISDFNLMIHNFKYNAYQKKALLKIYLYQYLLFDLRYFRFNQAAQTIRSLW
ncbi:glycosyltransferase family 2 protein [Pedobacter gandavensis]|uniref:glycosyltransferase family 2 protein n=1 Tax=Pedobacter gandavensis TaxID=2679963 RepID=UPI00292DF193|nr:glycosyltransferase [Pedobacter gandavensis]